MKKAVAFFVLLFVLVVLSGGVTWAAPVELVNVSYDPTREFYEVFNKAFIGSGSQARSVIEGNKADVLTLALAYDIGAVEKAGLIQPGWQGEFEKNSSPYTSVIVFLVRKGNPKNIKDWDDLVKKGVGIITPNPKTSGGARWNYLAAWAFANKLYNKDEVKIRKFIGDLFANVLVLDPGARGSTNTFVSNGQGDVLLAWENEAYLSLKEHPGEFEIVAPSISILAEPPVTIVDEIVDAKGTRQIAAAYLQYLYTDFGQELAGKNFYRPTAPHILEKFSSQFDLNINLITIDDPLFGGWEKAQAVHFNDGGIFDQIYEE